MIKESKGYFGFLSVLFFCVGLLGVVGLFFAMKASHIAVILALILATLSSFNVAVMMLRKAKARRD